VAGTSRKAEESEVVMVTNTLC